MRNLSELHLGMKINDVCNYFIIVQGKKCVIYIDVYIYSFTYFNVFATFAHVCKTYIDVHRHIRGIICIF